jgi:hypothetical protein
VRAGGDLDLSAGADAKTGGALTGTSAASADHGAACT